MTSFYPESGESPDGFNRPHDMFDIVEPGNTGEATVSYLDYASAERLRHEALDLVSLARTNGTVFKGWQVQLQGDDTIFVTPGYGDINSVGYRIGINNRVPKLTHKYGVDATTVSISHWQPEEFGTKVTAENYAILPALGAGSNVYYKVKERHFDKIAFMGQELVGYDTTTLTEADEEHRNKLFNVITSLIADLTDARLPTGDELVTNLEGEGSAWTQRLKRLSAWVLKKSTSAKSA